MAGVRDEAVRRLHDVTIAVAIAAAASVGVFAVVSAATIPGSAATSAPTGQAPTGTDDQPNPATGDGFAQTPPGSAQFGSGIAVTGGSH
jgi:hypothetical protein